MNHPASSFGFRLRRLSESLDQQIQRIYRRSRLEFEPRWYPVMVLLQQGRYGVMDMAHELGVTHAAVSQIVSAMKKAGLILTQADPSDGRRSLLSLSRKGQVLAHQLQPLWQAIAEATTELLQQEVPDLLPALDALESCLKQMDMLQRCADKLPELLRDEYVEP